MNNISTISTKKCLICKHGKKNDCLNWHIDPDTKEIWVWCVGKCQRGYGIREYAAKAGLTLRDFLKQDFDFREAPPNEVQKMTWPRSFIPLFHADAKPGLKYLESRKIEPDDNIFYDTYRKGIVFPYFYDSVFCGAQIRYIKPWVDESGEERKIDTVPGTRLGLLFYNWNQQRLGPNVKAIIVTEGAFNALAIQQSLSVLYPNVLTNPWKCVACSGSGLSKHHLETLCELKNQGFKVILAPDSDQAGIKMLRKAVNAKAITHYNMTMDSEVDWNDLLIGVGSKKFATHFLKSIKHVGKAKSDGSDQEKAAAEQGA
jgi:hypothetical protein